LSSSWSINQRVYGCLKVVVFWGTGTG
jgi:hypothetical protein